MSSARYLMVSGIVGILIGIPIALAVNPTDAEIRKAEAKNFQKEHSGLHDCKIIGGDPAGYDRLCAAQYGGKSVTIIYDAKTDTISPVASKAAEQADSYIP